MVTGMTRRMRESMEAAGYTPDTIAAKLCIPADIVHAWLAGKRRPTVKGEWAWALTTGVEHIWLKEG